MRQSSLMLLVMLLAVVTTACTAPEPTATATPTITPTATQTPQIGVELVTRAAPTQAIVQVTPTPLPTATLLPTATPVLYEVKTGDTVWSIAYTNGTIPDAVLALNPEVRPESMSVGDKLILPAPATPSVQNLEGTEVPLDVAIVSLQIYRTPVGSAWLMGEVENRGVFSAENIQIEINLADDNGESLGSLTVWAAASVVPAGERAPFGVLREEFSAEPAAITTSIISGNTVYNAGSRYLDLTIIDSEMAQQETHITVSGRISNTGEYSSTVSIIATLYDEVGNVSGFTFRSVEQTLQPGDISPFELAIAPPGASTIDYRVFAIGLRTTARE